MKETGNKVKVLREIMGHTQTEMSNQMGISQALYSQLENGNRRLTEKNEETLCELIGIPIEIFENSTSEELFNIAFKISNKMFIEEIFIEHIDLRGNIHMLTLNKN